MADEQLEVIARVAEKVERAKFVVGKRLRDARLGKSMSQVTLADKTSVSLRCIQKVEHGEVMVDVATLYRVGEVLDMTPEEFLRGLK